MNLHDYLTGLKADIDAGEGEQRTRALVRLALSHVDTDGDHGQMWGTACQSLRYVLDVAVNQGTAEDMRELRELLDESGTDFSAQPDVDEAIALIGQLYQHNYRPEETVEWGMSPLDDVMDAWNEEIGRAAMYAVLAYVEENWEEEIS